MAAGLLLTLPVFAQQNADARFRQIYEKEWAWRTGQAGVSASGESQPNNGRLDQVDAKRQQERLDYWQKVMSQLDAVDPKQLSPAEQVNYAVYREQIRNFVADQTFRQWQMPFNSDSAFWSELYDDLGGDSLRTETDYRRYVDRLGQVPAYFDQEIANMRAGLKRGFSVPRAVLNGRDVSIASVADVKDPTRTAFYAPLQHMPSTIPALTAAAIQADARAKISGAVIPAYGKLLAFFHNEYVPHARTTLAAEALPDGK
ncbi:MAG TPA: DUF885 family protein, partial [Dyella sp.]|nr:DUF885 family protein [Dyella sp.]